MIGTTFKAGGNQLRKYSIKLLVLVSVLLAPYYSVASALPPSTTSSYAGQGTWGLRDGESSEAQFRLPTYAVVDSQGIVYVSDTQNHVIRRIDPLGAVSTVAGSVEIHERNEYGQPVGGYRDGHVSEALFHQPRGLALHEDGTLFVADAGNGAIRAISATGEVSTLVDGLLLPTDLVVGTDGALYVSETLHHRILRITMDGTVAPLAGGGYEQEEGWTIGGYRDGLGIEAQLNEPTGLSIGRDGTLYVADTGNQRIRAISPNGFVSTIAGSGDEQVEGTTYIVGGYLDGDSAEAQFNFPSGLQSGEDGTIYVADTFNHRIRTISPEGRVGTLAGGNRYGGQNGYEASASFDHPTDVLVMEDGSVLVVDRWNHSLRLIRFYALPQEAIQRQGVQVVWDKELVSFDVPPQIVSGRTMIPIRQLAEAFGYGVQWNAQQQTITLHKGMKWIRLQVGSVESYGAVQTQLEVAPFVEDGRTFVPLRLISEAFSKQVDWLPEYQVVLIRE